MALAKNYGNKSAAEWGPIFNRILHNKITDLHRKTSVRDKVRGWLVFSKDTETHEDPIQLAPDPCNQDPIKLVTEKVATEQIIEAMSALSKRQRQAFLLRAVEGCNVEETAKAMGCSIGSVKTHYSRALIAMKTKLEAYW